MRYGAREREGSLVLQKLLLSAESKQLADASIDKFYFNSELANPKLHSD
jgi:hypothetical protein